jgi:hypothetical protein
MEDDKHGCWISYTTYPRLVVRYYARCRCGWKGPERFTRAETLSDRVAHKAQAAEDSEAA